MVFENYVERAMDGEANEPRGVGNCKYTEKVNDNNKAKTIEVYCARLQRK